MNSKETVLERNKLVLSGSMIGSNIFIVNGVGQSALLYGNWPGLGICIGEAA